jgi:hypothetical protein
MKRVNKKVRGSDSTSADKRATNSTARTDGMGGRKEQDREAESYNTSHRERGVREEGQWRLEGTGGISGTYPCAGDALGGEEWGPCTGLEGPIHSRHATAAGGMGTARMKVRPHLHNTAQVCTGRSVLKAGRLGSKACTGDIERWSC